MVAAATGLGFTMSASTRARRALGLPITSRERVVRAADELGFGVN